MPIRLPNWRILLALLFCASLALAPAVAEARAGGSHGGRPSSMGSRGARTYENNNAQPFSRSLTPQPSPGVGSATSGTGTGYGGGSFIGRHPFLTGLAGGVFGSWLFGHAGYAAGGATGGSAFGTLFWLIILGVLIYFAVRLFRRGRFSNRSGGQAWGGMAGPMMRSAGAAAAPSRRGQDINLADADLNAFQGIHGAVQDAWSEADLARLRPLMTPEMLGWFSEELTRNTSEGVRNIVSDVTLLKGELTESWEEDDLQYATALLRWRALDYTVRLGRSPGQPDFVAGGDPRSPVEAEEMWTFARGRGGQWLLSAIQQV